MTSPHMMHYNNDQQGKMFEKIAKATEMSCFIISLRCLSRPNMWQKDDRADDDDCITSTKSCSVFVVIQLTHLNMQNAD
jgi:hypothetical protein